MVAKYLFFWLGEVDVALKEAMDVFAVLAQVVHEALFPVLRYELARGPELAALL